MNTMLAADQIWVPSAWGREVLITNGADPRRCHVVCEGVDSSRYHPYHPQVESPILSYLISGKYELRKSIIETVYAWMQEFDTDPNVELIVKSSHFMNQEAKYNELSTWIEQSGINNVRILWGSISEDEMIDLYQQSHVFVLPTKGEGWGLPIIEAAASGMPIVSTFYSGHREYLQHITSGTVPVDYKLGAIECPEYRRFYPEPGNNWGLWARPDVDHLAECLRFAKNHWDFLAPNALKNSSVIRTEFSWANSVNSALKTLQNQGLLTG
jgi:glycosyltransferase involved in cell wall biosynthesis